jgi:hypothetical protein
MRQLAVPAAILSPTAIHLVASPSEEQEDHAEHGKLLQHARADRQRRRLGGVVVIEDRLPERDDVEDSASHDRRMEEGCVRVVTDSSSSATTRTRAIEHVVRDE